MVLAKTYRGIPRGNVQLVTPVQPTYEYPLEKSGTLFDYVPRGVCSEDLQKQRFQSVGSLLT